MIERDAALCYHLLKRSEAQVLGEIPPNAEQDHGSIEMTAFEDPKALELTEGIDRTELLDGLRQIRLASMDRAISAYVTTVSSCILSSSPRCANVLGVSARLGGESLNVM